MYFICWVTGGHFTRGFYCINLPLFDSCWSIYSGGRTISKRTPYSLDREDHQDFVIRCRTYSNSKISNQFWYTDSIRDLLLNCSFNEHSEYYALKRTRTSTLFSTRFWVSRVYHFTTKASWKWIVFNEYDIYVVWCMEYMTKVEYFYWSVMSYRPESDIQLLRFELSGGCLIYYQKDGKSNLFLDSIDAQRGE